MHFGEHVTVDGYGGDPDLLGSEVAVRSSLEELCNVLKMHMIITPVVVEASDNGIKDPGGWSGFVMIAESHISIHTFPRRRFVSADVYTCQNGLNPEFISDFFKKKFQLEEVEMNFIKRGEKYPERNLV